jgi:hypothetical protein
MPDLHRKDSRAARAAGRQTHLPTTLRRETVLIGYMVQFHEATTLSAGLAKAHHERLDEKVLTRSKPKAAALRALTEPIHQGPLSQHSFADVNRFTSPPRASSLIYLPPLVLIRRD